MIDKPFSNSASQAERAALLRQEHKLNEPATLFARARAGLDDDDVPGGRYAAQQNHFPGDPSVGYPPAAGWTRDAAMVPPEPSLGVAIDEMEVTGTPSEVAASLNDPVSSMVRIDEATESVSANSKPDDDLAGPLGVHPAPAGVTPVSPVREASPPCDPTAASGSVPPALSPDASDRGGEAVPSGALDRLGELLDRGLVRRTVKRRRL